MNRLIFCYTWCWTYPVTWLPVQTKCLHFLFQPYHKFHSNRKLKVQLILYITSKQWWNLRYTKKVIKVQGMDLPLLVSPANIKKDGNHQKSAVGNKPSSIFPVSLNLTPVFPPGPYPPPPPPPLLHTHPALKPNSQKNAYDFKLVPRLAASRPLLNYLFISLEWSERSIFERRRFQIGKNFSKV